jgi:hypothetical protein
MIFNQVNPIQDGFNNNPTNDLCPELLINTPCTLNSNIDALITSMKTEPKDTYIQSNQNAYNKLICALNKYTKSAKGANADTLPNNSMWDNNVRIYVNSSFTSALTQINKNSGCPPVINYILTYVKPNIGTPIRHRITTQAPTTPAPIIA